MAIKAVPAVSPYIPDIRRTDKSGVSIFFGISLPTCDSWVRKGMPFIKKGQRGTSWEFDLLAVARWRFGGEEKEDSDPENMSPNDRLTWFRGNIERRKDEIEGGKVVTAESAREAMSAVLKTLALSLDTLTDVVERESKLTPDQTMIVAGVVDRERRAIYATMIKIAAAH